MDKLTSQRTQIVRIMKHFGFTEAMCSHWTSTQLLNIAAMTVRHQQYLGRDQVERMLLLQKLEELVRELRQVN